MKILLAGNWRWPIYEKACAEALQQLGVKVIPFAWNNFFEGKFGKLQNVLPFYGPSVSRLNKKLFEAVKKEKPDVLWVWRGTHVLPVTLKEIKEIQRITLVSYNNDDPFGPKAHGKVPWHHHFLWRIYIKSLPYYNINFVYRSINVVEAKAHGAENVEIFMPYFVPHMHKLVKLSEEEKKKYVCDVVFVGHHENDDRVQSIKAIVDAGIHIKLFGGGDWNSLTLGRLFEYFGNVPSAQGKEYPKALCGAKICLAFLSKLNRDTYTRRCFEIPACGRVMLAERTKDLQKIFKEDEEACFFSSNQELVQKAKWLISNPDIREGIAQAGLRRVWADGHDVTSRVRWFLKEIENSKN
jgi:hypothetical protein